MATIFKTHITQRESVGLIEPEVIGSNPIVRQHALAWELLERKTSVGTQSCNKGNGKFEEVDWSNLDALS